MTDATSSWTDADPDTKEPPSSSPWSSRARAWMSAERIGWGILLGVLALPGAGLALWLLDFERVGWLAALVGVPVATAALWMLTLPWTRACHRRAAYQLDGEGLGYRHGVLWRHEIHVPRSRIQHTDVTQGPIERRYGLATLVVHTAGTSHARIAVEGLSAEEAYRLRDQLVSSTGDDGV